MGLRNPTAESKPKWKVINGFPRYQISEEGEVRNIETQRILKHITPGSGDTDSTYVILSVGGYSCRRRVKVLVKDAFGGYFE